MADTVQVRPADLLIDEVNPRLAEPNIGQREAQRTLAHKQGKKILKLSKHILQYGLNPLELPAVSRQADGRFIVIEGNRRLVALKALDNPDTLADAVPQKILGEIRKLSKKYQEAPIDFVECIEVKDREEIEPLGIPMKVFSDSDWIPVTGSEVKLIVFGAKRRWRSYRA